MAMTKSLMSGWRVALHIAGAMLGFIVLTAGGCHGECSCPPPPNSAVIQLGCLPTEPPVVKTTGPCSVCPVVGADGAIPQGAGCAVLANSQSIVVMAEGAGTCHVDLTFGNGATSSVDLDFASEWAACGADPHGCGEGFLATGADGSPDIQVSVPEAVCDAGLDAGASE
jgi:hypothetical protein